jgi:hypothetical protein
MKWIKNRNKFISEEAKLRDVILPTQKDVVSRTWGEKFLDYEEIEATDNIKQGKWKLSEEDKIEVLGQFFQADLISIYKSFNSLPDKFQEVFNKSIDISLIREDKDKFEKILNNFDIKKPSINQIGVLTDPVFRKISVSETLASEVIVRDENGRPIMGEDGRPQKVGKEPGEVIYSKNLTNINGFVDDFNRCFPDSKIDSSLFSSGSINQLISSSKEDFGGDRYSVEVDLYSRDMFLSIKHNAKDILNMSISRFYSSCQHLYSGGYRTQVLGNVFDPNSVPAFIIFDTPIYNNKEQLIAEQLPLCRMMIRNVESFDENKSSESQIFFDRAYPDRMQKIFSKIITKYSGNIENYSEGSYLFTPDVSLDDTLREPYMDRLGVQRGYYIGVNAKKVNFNYSHDWSRTKISPKAKIEEIIIETPNLPENFFEIPITPNWMKFKFIKINNLEPFKRIITESIAFEKCKINSQAIDDLMKFNDVLKKIQFTACEIKDIDLSKFKHLKEIQFIYSLDTDQLQQTLKGANFDKLVISSDLLSDNENKEFIKELKKQKKIVEIIGPVI